jgi:RNA polymerase sigma factor (sigma-70 family)
VVPNSGELFSKYSYLVYIKALKYKPNSLSDFDDYYQAASIGLLQAVKAYDPAKNPVFEAYASTCIKNAILHEIRKQRGFNAEYVESEYNKEPTDWIPENLEPHEQQIINMKITGCTLKEIGDYFGCSKGWAKEELAKVIRKIRKANE